MEFNFELGIFIAFVFGLVVCFFVINIHFGYLWTRAVYDTHELMRLDWQPRDAVVSAILTSNSSNIQKFLSSKIAVWHILVAMYATHKEQTPVIIEHTLREGVADVYLIGELLEDGLAEEMTFEFTREELEKNWHFFTTLPEEEQNRFKKFINERDDSLKNNIESIIDSMSNTMTVAMVRKVKKGIKRRIRKETTAHKPALNQARF